MAAGAVFRESIASSRRLRAARMSCSGSWWTRVDAPSAAYNACAVNVSQWAMSPESKPALNQRIRCAEVPWVNESGTA